MVRIQVCSDQNEFLYDCLSTSKIDEIAEEIIQISNLQSEINNLVLALEPRSKPCVSDSKAIPLIRALSEAKSYASKDQVMCSKPLSRYALRDYIQAIEREFMASYQLLGFLDSNQFQQLLTDLVLLQGDTTQLWWAGKELTRGKKLCDYIGKNEKTKIILKLQSPDRVVHDYQG